MSATPHGAAPAFAAHLRRARQEAGLSRLALAEAIGRSPRTVRRLEAEQPDATVPVDAALLSALRQALGHTTAFADVLAAAPAASTTVARGRWAPPGDAGVPPTPTPLPVVSRALAARFTGATPPSAPPASTAATAAGPTVAAPARLTPDRPAAPAPTPRAGALLWRRTLRHLELLASGVEATSPVRAGTWIAGAMSAVTLLRNGRSDWLADGRTAAVLGELALVAAPDGPELVALPAGTRATVTEWLRAAGDWPLVESVLEGLGAVWPGIPADALRDAVLRGLGLGVRARGG